MAHYTIAPSEKTFYWREREKTSSYLTNRSLFEAPTRKNEGPFFQGLHSIWQQFGSIVYFGPSVWSMIDDRRENHEPLARAQSCKLLSADCRTRLDIYQVDYSMPPYLEAGSSWSIPPEDRRKGADARWKYKPLRWRSVSAVELINASCFIRSKCKITANSSCLCTDWSLVQNNTSSYVQILYLH